MDRRIDLALSVGVALFGLLLLIAAQNISLGTIYDPVGTRGVPTFVALLFIVGGLLLTYRRLSTWRTDADEYVESDGKADEPGHPASALRAFTVMGISVVYAVALPILGFVVATIALLMALMWVLDVRSPRLLVGASLGYSLLVFLIFTQGLSVSLPPGILEGPLEALGLDR